MDNAQKLYLELIKKILTDTLRGNDEYLMYDEQKGFRFHLVEKYLTKKNLFIMKRMPFNEKARKAGHDWPVNAETMIGLERLKNIEELLVDIIENKIEGDCIETGVWRGGATILMAAILKVFGVTDKKVWVADSFEGLPKPNEEKYPSDKGDTHYTKKRLAISLEEVKNNFRNYDLLNDQIQFLKGWFKDTLPVAPIGKLSLIRLDGDMYESTMDGLVNLYPKLQKGGYIIIDDWGAVPACKKAVQDYRDEKMIKEEIIDIDWGGVYWKKK